MYISIFLIISIHHQNSKYSEFPFSHWYPVQTRKISLPLPLIHKCPAMAPRMPTTRHLLGETVLALAVALLALAVARLALTVARPRARQGLGVARQALAAIQLAPSVAGLIK